MGSVLYLNGEGGGLGNIGEGKLVEESLFCLSLELSPLLHYGQLLWIPGRWIR